MEFTTFTPLLWLLLLLAVAAGAWFSLVDRPAGLKWGSLGLRVLGIVLLVLALCRPFVRDRGEDLHVVFLVDVSESISLQAARDSLKEIDTAIESLETGDSWSLFAVADGVRTFAATTDLDKVLEQWQDGVADDAFRSGSRLADALLSTRLAFPAGKARRVVLLSDGQETAFDEDLAEAVGVLEAEQVDLHFAGVAGLDKAEAAVTLVEPSSPFAFEGEVVRIKVRVAANQPMTARLRMLHKGVAVQDAQIDLTATAQNDFYMDVDMTTPGPSVWTAELLPENDYFPINNQLASTVTVRGQPRVLVIHQDEKEMRPFSRALKEQEFDIDVRGKFGLPESLEEMLAFDCIILADVSATDLTVRQMDLLQKYVADFGGGLAMFGSDNSFGLGGYYKTPVEEVLPLISRFEKEKEKPSLSMVLVIDKSGSMSGVPIALARQAAKATVELLGPRDQIAVIGFDSNAQVVSDMRSAAERDAVQAAIDSLEAGGGTDVYPAMVVGRDMLDNAVTKVKHMIILSDGQTAQADHLGLTQAMADSGVTVSTVALGDGAARELMASIAEVGRGRYYETMDPSTVPQIFTKETMQASKSAIKEDLYGVVQVGDHPMLAGYADADLPFALGYVMTEPKPTAQVLLAAETGDPLMAVSRFGLGVGLAYTSDVTEKWGGEWLAWDEGGKFWAQVLRSIVRKSDAEGLSVEGEVRDGVWRVDVTRRDPDRSPVSKLDWDAQLLGENGKMSPVAIREIGLGKYRAEVPLGDADKLSLRLHDRDYDKLKVLHFLAPYPREYQLSAELPDALSACEKFQPALVREDLDPVGRHRPVASWFALAALACLLAGILLRRI